jgi:citronellol/citronellal dehydrogenase
MLPDGSLAGRVAVVTGGGTGLGKAMALELSRLGAAVAVVGRRREPLERTVARRPRPAS